MDEDKRFKFYTIIEHVKHLVGGWKEYPFQNCGTSVSLDWLNLETSYWVGLHTQHTQHALTIAWQITPKVGVVRSRYLILQSNVKLVIKQQLPTFNTCQFKTWCKGDKSNIENSIDNSGKDIWQNIATCFKLTCFFTRATFCIARSYRPAVSVCLSVCLSHSGIVSKRLNLS